MDKLLRLATTVKLTALDIGARGGVNKDLLPLAAGVDFYGFEPDPDECLLLNASPDKTPWRSLRYIPTALAESDRSIRLNLYRQRGCSSALRARQDVGELFSRGDYYIHDGAVELSAKTLDSIVAEYPIESPSFMKIDVQGMEVEVLQGARRTLSECLVGIRTEVSFFPIYDGQPLFAEVDQALRPFGFVPMRWLELHEWRRQTRVKYPAASRVGMPYSRGQMMHGDVLYLLHPEGLPEDTDADIRRLVCLALVAVCYGQLDHAYSVFSRPRVLAYVRDRIDGDPLSLLTQLSKRLTKATRWRRICELLALRFDRTPVRFS